MTFCFEDDLVNSRYRDILRVLQIPFDECALGISIDRTFQHVLDDLQCLIRTYYLGCWIIAMRPGDEASFQQTLLERGVRFLVEWEDGKQQFAVACDRDDVKSDVLLFESAGTKTTVGPTEESVKRE